MLSYIMTKAFPLLFLAITLSLTLSPVASQADTTIDTANNFFAATGIFGTVAPGTPGWGPLGWPDTTIGETFTTGNTDRFLSSFAICLAPFNGMFFGGIGTWNGQRIGQIVYQSQPALLSSTPAPGSAGTLYGLMEASYSPNISLSPNTTYIAFLSNIGVTQGPIPQNGYSWTITYLSSDIATGYAAYISGIQVNGVGFTDINSLINNNWGILIPLSSYPSIIVLEASGNGGGSPTPVPAAAWLLGSGLVGLAAMRRRFKK
jgi:hypothetical protein